MAAASAALTCPKCGTALAAGSRFCNACGAAIPSTAPAAPMSMAPAGGTLPAPVATGAAPSQPVDIRERVQDDRGFLKKLQLLIPGYRGYRQGEDARAADSFLRLQIADKVHRSVQTMVDIRQSLSQSGQFQGLTDLSPLLADLQQLEGEIRHAEQGYTGISPALRIQPAQIDQLYEYDYGFAQAADQVAAGLVPLSAAAQSGDAAATNAAVATTRAQVRQLDTAFKARIRAVEGILVA